MAMKDPIDLLLSQWGRERPDLDASPMGVVGRILRLALVLQERVETALAPYGLSVWQFDVLATLRRFGPPYRLAPKELLGQVMLSSGAMTNRIDRLEAAGLVRRLPDPRDRRGVLIELTEEGLALVDRALEARFAEAREAVSALPQGDRRNLEAGLRTLLLGLEEAGGEAPKQGG